MASVNNHARTWLGALGLLVALAAAPLGCGDEAPGNSPSTPDGSAGEAGASRTGDGGATTGAADAAAATPPPLECFKDTPRTHQELLNACWPDTVTAIGKTVTLPGGYIAGTPLPAPPR